MVERNPKSPKIKDNISSRSKCVMVESNKTKLTMSNNKQNKKKTAIQHKQLQSVKPTNGTKNKSRRQKKLITSKQDKGGQTIMNKAKREHTDGNIEKEKEATNKKETIGNYVISTSEGKKGLKTKKVMKSKVNYSGTNQARSPQKMLSAVKPQRKKLETPIINQDKDWKKEKERRMTTRKTTNRDTPTTNAQQLGQKHKQNKSIGRVASRNPETMNARIGMKEEKQKRLVVQVKPTYNTKRKQLKDTIEGLRQEQKPVGVTTKAQQNNKAEKGTRHNDIVPKVEKHDMHHHHHHYHHRPQQQQDRLRGKRIMSRHQLQSTRTEKTKNDKRVVTTIFNKIFHKDLFRHFRRKISHHERREQTGEMHMMDSTEYKPSVYVSYNMSHDPNSSCLKRPNDPSNKLHQQPVDNHSKNDMGTPIIKSKIAARNAIKSRSSSMGSTISTSDTSTSTSTSTNNSRSSSNIRMKKKHFVKPSVGIKRFVVQSQRKGTTRHHHHKNNNINDSNNKTMVTLPVGKTATTKTTTAATMTTTTAARLNDCQDDIGGQTNGGKSGHDDGDGSYYPLFLSDRSIWVDMMEEFDTTL